MGWSEEVIRQCQEALKSNFPLSPYEYSPETQGEDRLHRPRRLGVSIVILDKDFPLDNLREKERIFNESIAKLGN